MLKAKRKTCKIGLFSDEQGHSHPYILETGDEIECTSIITENRPGGIMSITITSPVYDKDGKFI